MAGFDDIANVVWILIGLLLLTVAGTLAFGRRASPERRILAAYLAILGALDLGAIAELLGDRLTIGDRYAVFFWTGDFDYVAHLTALAFLWRWPRPARLRSSHGAIMVAATLYVATAWGVWIFARHVMYAPPYVIHGFSGHPTLLGHLLGYHSAGVSIALGAAISDALARAARSPEPERQAATLILPGLAPWLFVWSSGYATIVVGGWLGIADQPLPEAALAGDPWHLTVPLILVGSFALPLLLSIWWWMRARSLLPLLLCVVGVVQFVVLTVSQSGVDFWPTQHVFTAVLVAHALARHGALGEIEVPAWQAWSVSMIAGMVTFLAFNTITIYLSRGAAILQPVGILLGLALGGAAAYAAFPRHRAMALGLHRSTDHESSTRRLEPYRAALAGEIGTGDPSIEIARRLRPLRVSLGISEREHAAMDFSLRAGSREKSGTFSVPEGELFLGRYRFGKKLGSGGAGTTHLCRDERLDRDVVLKTIKAGGEGSERLNAILREARAIAQVKHPNVATLYDVEQVGDEAIIVMEHVEGGTLKARIDAGALEPAVFRRVATGLLSALEAVHAAGIVHRDVKPSNVLLASGGEAKLADFGIARVPGLETTAGATREGAPGTVRYMSPEQARGKRVTGRSDIWSAGATLFEAWTGKPYVEIGPGESAVEVQMRVAMLGAFDRDVSPPAMRAWFARALAPDASERFQSAAEARDALP